MNNSAKIQRFCKKHPQAGPLFWLASIQFFIAQLLVALFWPSPYSIRDYTISDLGNTACGDYMGRYVCSPFFSWMNVSFMILGITMVAGSVLMYYEFRKSRASLVGFSFMALGGIGTIMVGLFPENVFPILHGIGAVLPFFVGNLALIVLGLSLSLTPLFRLYTILSGVVSLTAFLLFITDNYLGLGLGGMERLAAHPLTIWLIIFGAYTSENLYRLNRPTKPTARRLVA